MKSLTYFITTSMRELIFGLEMIIVSLSAAMIGYGIGYLVSAVYHINV